MPSLLEGAQPEAQAVPQENPQQAPVSPGAEGQQPTNGRQAGPEQEKQLEYFLQGGTKLLAHPETKKKIIALAKVQDPRDGLAEIIVPLLTKLENKINTKMPVDLEVVAEAGRQLLEHAFDIAEEAGGKEFSPEERLQGFITLVPLYLQNAVDTGKMSVEEYNQLVEIMKQTPEGQAIAAQIEAPDSGEVGQPAPQSRAPAGQAGMPTPQTRKPLLGDI